MEQPVQQDLYGDNPRHDVAPFIPHDVRSVLEVGCGRGGFGPTLRAALGPTARIEGIEAVASQAEIARTGHEFDEVVTGYFPDDMPAGRTYDLIVFNDVLEHLIEPEPVLQAAHQFLTPGGRVLSAIPSIQYVVVTSRLIFGGRWDYTDIGTLDRTHLRFFTRKTMIEMFERNGYTVEMVRGAGSVARHFAHRRRPISSLARHGANLLGDAQWVHFIVLGRSRPS